MESKRLQKTLRAFTIDKLSALKTIIDSPNPTIESGAIGETLGTASTSLGGTVSSLTRTKIDNKPLVKIVTITKNRQRRLRYNEEIASKNKMRGIIKNILKDLK